MTGLFRTFKNSVFVKFSAAFILVGMIPLFALTIFSLQTFTGHVERYTVSNLKQMTMYLGYNIDNAFRDYNEITKLMYTNNVAESSRTNQTMNVDVYEQINQIPMQDFLNTILHSDQHIRTVYFVRASDGKLYFETRESAALMPERLPLENWLRPLRDEPNDLAIHLTHPADYFHRLDRQVMTLGRNLIDISGPVSSRPKVVGTLFIDVDSQVFEALFHELSLGATDELYIVDDRHRIFYSNRADAVGTERPELERYVKDRLAIRQSLSFIDGQVILLLSPRELYEQLSSTQSAVFAAVAICALVLIAMGVWFSRRLATPIRKIMNQMMRVESGNLEARVESFGNDEIGRLSHGFNRMVDRLKTFIEEAYVAEIGRKQAELNALKSQIRPHYLYNTLEVIRMNAVHNDDEEVGDMILSLSNQLKYVIDYGEDWVSIRREIEHLLDYFYIIRVRFENRIELRVDIGEGVDREWQMLKLSLQPLVENAIQHGIRPKGGKGTVLVNIEANADVLEVTVYDDGVGMDEAELERLAERLRTQGGSGAGVGLKNVYERIRSVCGESYGLGVSSRKHVGTSVTMRLPIRKGGSPDDTRRHRG